MIEFLNYLNREIITNDYFTEFFSEILLSKINISKIYYILYSFENQDLINLISNFTDYFNKTTTNNNSCVNNILIVKDNFKKIISNFIIQNPEKGFQILDDLKNYLNDFHDFTNDDYIADIVYIILINKEAKYDIRLLSVEILNFIAYEVNRFYVQNIINQIKDDKIVQDPYLLSKLSD